MQLALPVHPLLAGGRHKPLGYLSNWQLRLVCILWVFGFFFSPTYVALWDSTTPHLWEGFLLFGKFSFMTPSSGWVSVPNSFVFLFVFYILSYLLSKRMCCLSGCPVSSANLQKLFCGSCSAFKWAFDEVVGEKVVSLSYSCTILGLTPGHKFIKKVL